MTAILTLGHDARNCATAKISRHDSLFLKSFFPKFFCKAGLNFYRKGKFELLMHLQKVTL